MRAETRSHRFPKRTIRQVRLDCNRSLSRAKLCSDGAEVLQFRCVDDSPESEASFGKQLWFFDGWYAGLQAERCDFYGVVEYSVQFGLNELVEDRVFDSEWQRNQYFHLYQRGSHQASWRCPANRWLLLGLLAVASVWISYLLLRSLLS